MATHPSPARSGQQQTKDATDGSAGTLGRWRARRADRKQARLISVRNRRMLARWLRRTANRAPLRRPLAISREPLLAYRAAAVRTDLLEIATLLEHTQSADAARIAALQNLLADGCDSPLYNPEIHISELRATLHYVRAGL